MNLKGNVLGLLSILVLFNLSVQPILAQGPPTPELSSFESATAKSTVDQCSGTFVYNIPLLNIPGTGKGFQMSLSYHSGIKTMDEASWVGLGWNMTPGAITRSVVGYPDDYSDTRTAYTTTGAGYSLSRGGYSPFASASHSNNINVGVFSDAHLTDRGTDFVFKNGLDRSTSGYAIGAAIAPWAVWAGEAMQQAAWLQNKVQFGSGEANRIYGSLYNGKCSWTNLTLQNATSNIVEELPIGDNTLIFSADNAVKWRKDMLADMQSSCRLPAYDSYSIFTNDLSGSIQPYIFETGGLFNTNYYDAEHGPNVYPVMNAFTDYPSSATAATDGYNAQSANYDIVRNSALNFSSSKKVNFKFRNDPAGEIDFTGHDQLSLSSPYKLWTPSVNNSQGFDNTKKRLTSSKHIDWYSISEITSGTAKANGFIDCPNSRRNPSNDAIGGFTVTDVDGTSYHFALPVYSYGEISTTKENLTTQTITNQQPYATSWLLTAITGADYVDANGDGLISDDDLGYWVRFDYGEWSGSYHWRSPQSGSIMTANNKKFMYQSGYKEVYYLDAIRTKTHTALFVKDIRNDGKGVGNTEIGGNLPGSNISLQTAIDNLHYYIKTEFPGGITTDNAVLFYWLMDSFYVHHGLVNPVIQYANTMMPVSTLRLDKIYVLANSDLDKILSDNSISTNNGSQFLSGMKQHSNDLDKYAPSLSISSWTSSSPGLQYSIQQGDQYEFGSNVIDKYDISGTLESSIQEKSIQSFHFNTNYSLCPYTDNSYDSYTFSQDCEYVAAWKPYYEFSYVLDSLVHLMHYYPDNGEARPGDILNYFNSQNCNLNPTRTGKLTLNSIETYGAGGQILSAPPLQFDYNLTNPVTDVQDITIQFKTGTSYADKSSVGAFTSTHNYSAGDIVSISRSGSIVLYGLVFSKSGNDYKLHFIGKEDVINDYFQGISNPSTLSACTITQTKNAPYNSNYFDLYGDYKPDFIGYSPNPATPTSYAYDMTSVNIGSTSSYYEDAYVPKRTELDARVPSNISAPSKDAWSIRSIKNEYGGFLNVDYESNRFSKVAVTDSKFLKISGLFFNPDFNIATYYFNKEADLSGLDGAPIEAHLCFLSNDSQTFCPVYYSIVTAINNSISSLDTKTKSLTTSSFTTSDANNLMSHMRGLYDFRGGYIVYSQSSDQIGGGIRVKSTTTDDNAGNKYTDIYSYLDANGLSTGSVVSDRISKDIVNIDEMPIVPLLHMPSALESFQATLNDKFNYLVNNPSLLPSDNVIYRATKLTRLGADGRSLGYTITKYKDFDLTDVSITHNTPTESGGSFAAVPYSNFTDLVWQATGTAVEDKGTMEVAAGITEISDKSGSTGALLSSEKYNTKNQLLESYKNNYDNANSQFLTHQVFIEQKINSGYSHIDIASHKEFKTLLTSSTSYKEGIQTTTNYSGFDPFSGEALIVSSQNGYGETVRHRKVPAYTLYAYSHSSNPDGGMDSKLYDPHNKNMLTQPAEQYIEKYISGNWQTMSVNVSGWNKNWPDRRIVSLTDHIYGNNTNSYNFWRNSDKWTWKGGVNPDGTLTGFVSSLNNLGSNTDFNWSGSAQIGGWQQVAKITKYDFSGHALENKNVTSNYTSTKLGYGQTKVIVSAKNSNYEEFSYSGFEDYDGFGYVYGGEVICYPQIGGITYAGGQLPAHTGDRAILISGTPTIIYRGQIKGSLSPNQASLDDGLATGKIYRASVWVYNNNNNIGDAKLTYAISSDPNGSGAVFTSTGVNESVDGKVQSGNWYLINVNISIPDNINLASPQYLVIGLSSNSGNLFDDFRFHPLDASITSYVYEATTGRVSHILDANNFYTRYEYDNAGRISNTYREISQPQSREKKLSSQLYHFSQ